MDVTVVGLCASRFTIREHSGEDTYKSSDWHTYDKVFYPTSSLLVVVEVLELELPCLCRSSCPNSVP